MGYLDSLLKCSASVTLASFVSLSLIEIIHCQILKIVCLKLYCDHHFYSYCRHLSLGYHEGLLEYSTSVSVALFVNLLYVAVGVDRKFLIVCVDPVRCTCCVRLSI
jgi:hypothetical protein